MLLINVDLFFQYGTQVYVQHLDDIPEETCKNPGK